MKVYCANFVCSRGSNSFASFGGALPVGLRAGAPAARPRIVDAYIYICAYAYIRARMLYVLAFCIMGFYRPALNSSVYLKSSRASENAYSVEAKRVW